MVATKHTLVALVQDRPGVLNRMASLFRRRGFNIDSIAVGPSETPGQSRVTFVVDGATMVVEQVRKQLDKVVDVVKVVDITSDNLTVRELALIKVRTTPGTRSEVIEIATVFRANIVDVGLDSLTIEITGDEEKLEAMLSLLRGFGIKEIARTGRIAMVRGGASAPPAEGKPARARSKNETGQN